MCQKPHKQILQQPCSDATRWQRVLCFNKSVFSFLCQLITWQCPHLLRHSSAKCQAVANVDYYLLAAQLSTTNLLQQQANDGTLGCKWWNTRDGQIPGSFTDLTPCTMWAVAVTDFSIISITINYSNGLLVVTQCHFVSVLPFYKCSKCISTSTAFIVITVTHILQSPMP